MYVAACLHQILSYAFGFLIVAVVLNEAGYFLSVVNDHGGQVAPWEEENGFYGIMVGYGYTVVVVYRSYHIIFCNVKCVICITYYTNCRYFGLFCLC